MVVHENGADDEDVAGAGNGGDDGNDEKFDNAVPRDVPGGVAGVPGVHLRRQILGYRLVHFL